MSRGGSLSRGGLCPGEDLCPGEGLCPEGVSVWGVSVTEILPLPWQSG